MKITYKFINNEKTTVDVNDEWAEVITSMDKESYNNWHKLNRHSAAAEGIVHSSSNVDEDFDGDHMDLLPDTKFAAEVINKENYEIVCDFIKSHLKKDQAEILIAIILDRWKVKEYATFKGISEDAASARFRYAKKILKKYL